MQQSALDANKIALIGAPSSAGARFVGQEQGPQSLREAGLVQLLQSDGHEVVDLGDLAQASFAADRQHPKRLNSSAPSPRMCASTMPSRMPVCVVSGVFKSTSPSR